jgi:hypothetical protein
MPGEAARYRVAKAGGDSKESSKRRYELLNQDHCRQPRARYSNRVAERWQRFGTMNPLPTAVAVECQTAALQCARPGINADCSSESSGGLGITGASGVHQRQAHQRDA